MRSNMRGARMIWGAGFGAGFGIGCEDDTKRLVQTWELCQARCRDLLNLLRVSYSLLKKETANEKV
jgi:hypothetical protein